MNIFNRIPRFFRETSPTIAQQRKVALILLLCQAGITVSGAIVRVTGSGLGCVTWPNCHPGSLVPLKGAAPFVHQMIEWGNRLLTFVVAAAAVAAVVAVYMARRRFELKVYAWVGFGGVVVQAILGAISVFLKLDWWAVAMHFLPSMVLVWVAAMLFVRIPEPDHGTPTKMFPQVVRTLGVVATVALSIVLITGTMVTGSGVHSGDAGVGMEGRLNVDTAKMAVIHAMCMYAYLLATVVMVILLFRSKKATPAAKRAGIVLILIVLIQWAIGVFQFYQHIPRWTVPVHIGFASAVTACTAILWAHGYRRLAKDAELITGSLAGDEKYQKSSKRAKTN